MSTNVDVSLKTSVHDYFKCFGGVYSSVLTVGQPPACWFLGLGLIFPKKIVVVDLGFTVIMTVIYTAPANAIAGVYK